MMKARHILIALALMIPAVASAQKKGDAYALTDAEIDTVTISAKPAINDYKLLGVYAGPGLGMTLWNPSMKQDMQFLPFNVGFCFTRYEKMFGFLPFFGFQAGAELGVDGYRLREGYYVYGYNAVRQTVAHAFYQGHIHADFWKMKVIANIGMYGGYRLGISRWNEFYENSGIPEYKNAFAPSDYRFDYGIRGGVGFGFVFDPIEIHLTANYKHSLQNIYHPDYLSHYYYRYANPMALYINLGVHYQISNRIGRTREELKKEALRRYEAGY